MYPAPPKQRGVASRVVTSLVATIFILSILANVYAFIIITSLTASSESIYRKGTGSERVVIVPVIGGINDEMADYVRKSFKGLEDDVPAAIVLRINSAGAVSRRPTRSGTPSSSSS